MVARFRFALLVVGFLASAINISEAQTGITAHAAAVMTDHFETVVYTDSRFLTNFRADNKHEESLHGLRLPFLELIAGMMSLGPTSATTLESRYASFLVGAKDFVMPEGLGLVGSHKCYIGISEEGAQPQLGEIFRQATIEPIDEHTVWTWSMPPYEGHSNPTSFFAAQIGHSYLLVANNREDFRYIARLLASTDTAIANSLRVFDWDNFSAHQYWAYRLLRRDGNSDGEASALTRLDADVTAISFAADIDKRQAVLRVQSSDSEMKTLPKVLPESELMRFHVHGPGVWEANIPLTQDHPGSEAMAGLFYSFGMGIAY